MARIIEARVRQKAATLEEWNNSDLESLDGEQLFVRSDVDDKVIGFKLGAKGKKFSELDYPDFTVRGKVSPASTWVGRQSGVYIPTSNGVYNGIEVNLGDGYQVLYWDGETLEKVVYPVDYSGAVFGGAIDDSKDLSTPPTEPTWYIASPGDYNTTPPITLTENSILSWDGNEWSHIPFELEVRGEFLVADNIAEVRNITPEVAQLLVNGTYKGVEVLGYYEKGDTPAPIIYYLSDTTEEDDGGSVIEAGGIKLEHEFVGSVSYKYFGALLTYESRLADWEAIKKTQAYANKTKIEVVQNYGDIYPNSPIEVKTSLNLKGCTIHITDEMVNKNLFNITSDKEWVNVVVNNQSELVKKEDKFTDLSNVKNALVKIESDEILCQRHTGGSTSTEYKKDVLYIGDNGYSVNSYLIHDFTTGVVTMKYRSCDEVKIYIEGLNISWEFTNANSWCQVLNISRSNVDVIDFNFNIIDGSPINPSSFRRSLLNITDFYNVNFYNIDAENISTATTASAYIINMSDGVRSNFENVKLIRGWGSFGTNRVKNINIDNSTINRFDIHISGADISLNNTYIIGGWGVLIGYGMGYVRLTNCTSDFSMIDGKVSDYVVRSAGTYGLWFAGDVIVNNHVLYTRGTGNKKLLSITIDDLEIDYKQAYNVETPSLIANNIIFKNESGESINAYDIQNGRLYYLRTSLEANSKKLVMPKQISVSGIVKDVDDDLSYTQACFIEVPNQLTGFVEGSSKIYVDNIQQNIHSYFTSNIPTSYNADVVLKPLIYFSEVRGDAGSTDHRLTVRNSNGGLKFNGKSKIVKITDSHISHLDWYFSTSYPTEEVEVRDCVLYPNLNAGKTQFVIKNTTLVLFDSQISLPTYNSNNMPIAFTGNFLFSQNNSVRGNFASVTDAQLILLDRYYNNGRFKKSTINQSAAVANVASANATSDTASTATDVAGVVTDLNDLITKYNALVTLTNEIKAQLNAKLSADRASGQQSTT